MAYPIFDDTMIELTWQELAQEAKKHTPVILPISIIEEHGPHMDLAVDVYLGHQITKDVKHHLEKKKINVLIAPPLYWGISHSTEHFPGTFSIRPDTLKALMYDILFSLSKWGFNIMFITNSHGDHVHESTIISGVKYIRNELGIDVVYLLAEEDRERYKLNGQEDYILYYTTNIDDEASNKYWDSEFADIHAGGHETSSMLKYFPQSVRKEMVPHLGDSQIRWNQLGKWLDHAKVMTPLGYCGNPSHANVDEEQKIDWFLIHSISLSIENYLKK